MVQQQLIILLQTGYHYVTNINHSVKVQQYSMMQLHYQHYNIHVQQTQHTKLKKYVRDYIITNSHTRQMDKYKHYVNH
jgi:hypothetical protein